MAGQRGGAGRRGGARPRGDRDGAFYFLSGAVVVALGVIAYFNLGGEFGSGRSSSTVVKIELPAAPGTTAPR
jgi:hypothetical protein